MNFSIDWNVVLTTFRVTSPKGHPFGYYMLGVFLPLMGRDYR